MLSRFVQGPNTLNTDTPRLPSLFLVDSVDSVDGPVVTGFWPAGEKGFETLRFAFLLCLFGDNWEVSRHSVPRPIRLLLILARG